VDLNNILSSIKDALALTYRDIEEIYKLENFEISPKRIKEIFSPKGTKKYKKATYEELGVFLDGLITKRRGKKEEQDSKAEEIILDNNLILKKLKIALNLDEYELSMIFELGDKKLSKSAIKDILRNPSNPKFRELSDKELNAFLKGLVEFYYEVPKSFI